jgi:hypothetical protein
MGLDWWAWAGAAGAAVFAVVMAMPNRKLYASCPRWIARVIRVSAIVYGVAAVANLLFMRRFGDRAAFAVAIVLVLSSIVLLMGVIVARRASSRGAA